VTFTRPDGEFDFEVNGGVSVTLVFEDIGSPPAFLPAVRDVTVPKLGRIVLPDVKLVLKSTNATSVALNGTWLVESDAAGFL
jgi:hypothetical protein